MEKNWLVIILVIIAVIVLIIFLIYRNHKDEKDLMTTLIGEDQVPVPKEPDTEVDPVSEK
jgi:flagellar biosynthesis/type III secretory pathway M-ring protein FliF/YscJ